MWNYYWTSKLIYGFSKWCNPVKLSYFNSSSASLSQKLPPNTSAEGFRSPKLNLQHHANTLLVLLMFFTTSTNMHGCARIPMLLSLNHNTMVLIQVYSVFVCYTLASHFVFNLLDPRSTWWRNSDLLQTRVQPRNCMKILLRYQERSSDNTGFSVDICHSPDSSSLLNRCTQVQSDAVK